MSSRTRQEAEFRAERTAAKYGLRGVRRDRAITRGIRAWEFASGRWVVADAATPGLSRVTRDLLRGVAAAAIGGVVARALFPEAPVANPPTSGLFGSLFNLYDEKKKP